jgi:DNA-binding MarR family transcriptional regulator
MYSALEVDNPANCTSFKTKRFVRQVGRHFDGYLVSVELKKSQFTLLTHVLRRGPISTSALATVTRNLKPIALNRWVEQGVGHDSRSRIISITAAGKKKQDQAVAHWQRAQ